MNHSTSKIQGEKKKGGLIISEPQCKREGFSFTNYAGQMRILIQKMW